MGYMKLLPLILTLMESLPKIVAAVEQTKAAVENATDEKTKIKAELAGVIQVLTLIAGDI